jgi:uncharacterized membrane protein YgaE (UPF0421/DUF939 family)
VLQQTAAAVAAWQIALLVVDHPAPFFAPIAAVVGLNATLGRRGSNAVRLLVGVVVGIVLGELAVVVVGGGIGTLALGVSTAMLVAQLIDGARIVVAQAAVSAILITAFGDPAEGPDRLVEALIGAGMALTFSQLLFSPEPLRLLRRAESAVLSGMADGLRLAADALERNDPELATRSLGQLRGLRTELTELATVRKASDRIVRHSATWRARSGLVVRERESADQLDLLAGSCLMLARTAMATTPSQRTTLTPGVRELAAALADLSGQPGDRPTRQHAAERALELARWVLQHEAATAAQSALATACAAVRMVALDVMVFAGVGADEAREAMRAAAEDVEVADPPAPPRRSWARRVRRRVRSVWPRRRRSRSQPRPDGPEPASGGGPEEPAG